MKTYVGHVSRPAQEVLLYRCSAGMRPHSQWSREPDQ